MQEQVEARSNWHAVPVDEVFDRVGSRREGLSQQDAEKLLASHGRNTLEEQRPPGVLRAFLGQLKNPLVLMLIAAATLSLVAGHAVDAAVILAVVILNSVIGVIQESRAEQALKALRELSAPRARVVRGGEVIDVPAADIVPGDVVVLETGDRSPADLRLFEAVELRLDESALTGESEPIEKSIAAVPSNTALADRANMAWTSTSVTGGRGRGVVVETGMSTVIGRIATDVQTARREDTPLQKRLARLSVVLGVGSVTAATVIFIFGLVRGFDVIDMLLFAVAAAVSAIPEGLPAVVSVVLALGVQRMSQRSAIIRRLPAVETLGSTTVICSDKTGTITRNQMTVQRIWTAENSYDVQGEGFEPTGALVAGGREVRVGEDAALDVLLGIGLASNHAQLLEEDGRWSVRGNPTDGALLVAAAKAGLGIEDSQRAEPLHEIPLSSSAKYAAALTEDEAGGRRLHVKGAPERVLGFCNQVLVGGETHPLDAEWRERIGRVNDDMAGDALRVLAGAFRDVDAATDEATRELAENNLTFVGMWGMLDPPREEAVRAVADAQRAGIRVAMITGDHASTAAAIARQAGITGHGETVVTGHDLDTMSDEELAERVADIAVYARVAPEHKYRIVQALKDRGEVVAMTGDGVNDAPALKAADIGIAMGRAGTEVAKEAADMVLGDDNFATIVSAVEEGRVIYSNLRRVVAFLISTTTAEVIVLFSALALGFDLPLTAVMILWINLVADGISTIPLGLEPKHSNVLEVPPRRKTEGILTAGLISRLLTLGAVAALVTMLLFVDASGDGELAYAQTVAFTSLAALEWFKAITWRTSQQSVFSVGLFSNRWLVLALSIGISLQVMAVQSPIGNVIFGTEALMAGEWLLIIAAASSVLVLDEIGKAVIGRRTASD